jgi:hypothetical protein
VAAGCRVWRLRADLVAVVAPADLPQEWLADRALPREAAVRPLADPVLSLLVEVLRERALLAPPDVAASVLPLAAIRPPPTN